ncbi:MAG: hypothetical protein QGI45_07190 [Myxococcota bacterium]|nr:hypothetical protein [Myxococcota bacterium]
MSSSSHIGGGGQKPGSTPPPEGEISSTQAPLEGEAAAAAEVATAKAGAEAEGAESSAALKAEIKAAEIKAGIEKDIGADTVVRKSEISLTGPQSSAAPTDDVTHDDIVKIFQGQIGVNPYNEATSEKLHGEIKTTASYQSAVSSLQNFLENPNATNQSEFMSRMKGLASEFPHGNIMEVLFLVFKDSIKEVNEDKKYFLKKLMMYNDMAEGLSEYLQELLPASDELGKKIAAAKSEDAGMQTVSVDIRNFDLTSTGADGKLQQIGPTKTENMNQFSLSNRIKEVESMQETVRNKRQMASTAFQNFDQKTNQLYNLLSSVLKGMGEMRMSTTRNML